VFAVSYSGNTIETLSSLKGVFDAGCDVVVLTSGGVLGDIAKKRDLTLIEIQGGRPPRASLGYLLVPLGVVMERLGFYDGFNEEVDTAVDRMGELYTGYCFDVLLEENPAKKLAVELAGWLPVVYGSNGILDICAERWVGQLQENSKLLAFYLSFPELCHNQSIGWVDSSGMAEDIVVLPLIGEWENDAISEQRDALLEIAQESGARVNRIEVSGNGGLVSALECLYLADYTSIYLAMLNSADPTAIGSIDLIKERVEGYKQALIEEIN
jgi:glucose/mannose-6-phosphate isomerase